MRFKVVLDSLNISGHSGIKFYPEGFDLKFKLLESDLYSVGDFLSFFSLLDFNVGEGLYRLEKDLWFNGYFPCFSGVELQNVEFSFSVKTGESGFRSFVSLLDFYFDIEDTGFDGSSWLDVYRKKE